MYSSVLRSGAQVDPQINNVSRFSDKSNHGWIFWIRDKRRVMWWSQTTVEKLWIFQERKLLTYVGTDLCRYWLMWVLTYVSTDLCRYRLIYTLMLVPNYVGTELRRYRIMSITTYVGTDLCWYWPMLELTYVGTDLCCYWPMSVLTYVG